MFQIPDLDDLQQPQVVVPPPEPLDLLAMLFSVLPASIPSGSADWRLFELNLACLTETGGLGPVSYLSEDLCRSCLQQASYEIHEEEEEEEHQVPRNPSKKQRKSKQLQQEYIDYDTLYIQQSAEPVDDYAQMLKAAIHKST